MTITVVSESPDFTFFILIDDFIALQQAEHCPADVSFVTDVSW